MAIADSRFALPPEDFEEAIQSRTGEVKGKGKSSSNTSRKRKRQREVHEDSDSEPDLYDLVLNGPVPSTSAPQERNDQEDQEEDNENGASETEEPLNFLPKPLQLDELQNYNKKVDRTGIIYLSRIPPGMGPSKVKHILSHYGEIGRIYLVAAEDDKSSKGPSHHTSKSGKERYKHRAHRFKEGWVEFLDKTVARSTAELLNANLIGDIAVTKSSSASKKNGGTKRWRDDVWTMKYLPKFKWNMLSEQVAIEAATRQALLRNQLAQSKKEQAEYLRQVERANTIEKIQQKKKAKAEKQTASGGTSSAAASASKKPKKERHFEQREVIVNKGKGGVDSKLSNVLDNLF